MSTSLQADLLLRKWRRTNAVDQGIFKIFSKCFHGVFKAIIQDSSRKMRKAAWLGMDAAGCALFSIYRCLEQSVPWPWPWPWREACVKKKTISFASTVLPCMRVYIPTYTHANYVSKLRAPSLSRAESDSLPCCTEAPPCDCLRPCCPRCPLWFGVGCRWPGVRNLCAGESAELAPVLLGVLWYSLCRADADAAADCIWSDAAPTRHAARVSHTLRTSVSIRLRVFAATWVAKKLFVCGLWLLVCMTCACMLAWTYVYTWI